MYTTVPIIAAYYLLSRPNWICTDNNNKNYLLSNNFACFQKSHEFQKDYLRCMFCYFSITEKNPPTLHKQAFPQAPKVIRICNCQGHKYSPGKAKSMNSVHFNFFLRFFAKFVIISAKFGSLNIQIRNNLKNVIIVYLNDAKYVNTK